MYGLNRRFEHGGEMLAAWESRARGGVTTEAGRELAASLVVS